MLDRNDLQAIAQLMQVAIEPLQKDVGYIKDDMVNVKSDIADMKDDITNMKNDITGVKDNIVDVKEDITGVKSNIADMKKDIAGAKGDITNMKDNIASVKCDIADIKDDMHTNNEFLLSEMERLHNISARKVDDLSAKVDTIRENKETTDYLFQQLSALKKRVDKLEGKIA